MGYEEIHVIPADLAKDIKQGLEGRFSRTYFLIGVSDGMSNGTDGMRFQYLAMLCRFYRDRCWSTMV
jgi:hypothetical protein